MERAVVARLIALEFIVERFLAEHFAALPQDELEAFVGRSEALAHQMITPRAIEAGEEGMVEQQNQDAHDAIIHRLRRLADRTSARRATEG